MTAPAGQAQTVERRVPAEADVIDLRRRRAQAILPGTGVAEANREFLEQVDERLAAAIRDLDRTWRVDLGSPGATVDILAGQDLPELLQSLSVSGGKRIRPSMCFWGWVAAGGQVGGSSRSRRVREQIVQAGAALELLHIFALIHDDVMDESASRRGQPSVHTQAASLHTRSAAAGSAARFGESIAVLVGDLAHAEADALIAELPAPIRRVWRLMVVELVHGQSRDVIGTAAGRRDLAHARQVARAKSGNYTVQRPLELGAAAAGAENRVIGALGTYGQELGEAFALRDDLLGVWGDPEVTGKPAGDDLWSGKPTVILALAQERVEGSARSALDRVGTPELDAADVECLQAALVGSGVADAVEARITAHVHHAVDALATAELDPDGVLGLSQLAQRIAWRDR